MNEPFFVLAPMDDVTETVFRRIVAECAAPDLFFTEFVNVDGLQSPGRDKLLPKLRRENEPYKVVAQIWGKQPENFYKTAQEIVDMGFDGIDINFGCPDKAVVKNGCCSAMILPENRDRAVEIIDAVKRAASGRVPVSVKTRLGFNDIDYTWHELILNQGIDMLTVHGRTRKEMSKVPAQWGKIAEVRALRDRISPKTLIVGNGDVMNRAEGVKLARESGVDGVMIGRGALNDPYCFSLNSPWAKKLPAEKIALFKRHVEMFMDTYRGGERNFQALKKFAKLYVNGFENATDIRDMLVRSNSIEQLRNLLNR